MSGRIARRHLLRYVAIAVLAAVATAAAQTRATTITGAGATFPYPIYSRWFDEYTKRTPQVQFSYQSIGSGGGIRQLTDEFVFFGATDAPMLEEELLAAPARIVHIPTVVGAVVPVYNVPVAFAVVDELPRNPALKVSLPAVAALYEARANR